MDIGKMIKMARIERDMSQEVLADKVGVTKAAISAYEKGRQMPGGEVLLKISKELDLIYKLFPECQKKQEPNFVTKEEFYNLRKDVEEIKSKILNLPTELISSLQ